MATNLGANANAASAAADADAAAGGAGASVARVACWRASSSWWSRLREGYALVN